MLPYQADLKFVAAVLPYGRLHFEKIEETDWKKYSEKVRAMLDEHLEVCELTSPPTPILAPAPHCVPVHRMAL